jgi:membrane protein DedA with SNARE-associated domain
MENFLTHAGYLALIVFAFVEACSIPFISAELTFGFAGVLAWQGHLNLLLVIIIGTLAELAGSYVSYALGRRGGRPMVERLSGRFLITRTDIDRAERFFDGHGSWSVFVARLIPVVRSITGLVSGFLEVPAVPFGLYNAAATALWATGFSVLGYSLGSDWNKLSHKISDGGYILFALVLLAFAAAVLHRLRHVRRARARDAFRQSADDSPAAPAATGAPGPGGAPGAAGPRSRPGSHRRTDDGA